MIKIYKAVIDEKSNGVSHYELVNQLVLTQNQNELKNEFFKRVLDFSNENSQHVGGYIILVDNCYSKIQLKDENIVISESGTKEVLNKRFNIVEKELSKMNVEELDNKFILLQKNISTLYIEGKISTDIYELFNLYSRTSFNRGYELSKENRGN